MYQNCCKKCGSIALHTEVKGNNTGLYCDDCGAWVKWIGKDELRAFEYSKSKEEKENNVMSVYLVTRPCTTYCQDYAMVVIAKDEKHAERKARLSSDDFRECQKITITKIDMNEEQCVLIANTGA